MKDKKQALAEVQAKLYKQTYCPGKKKKKRYMISVLIDTL
jgi:hypothetical protein